ncbi:MAG: FxLYD domain-containing protein [Rhodothermales bacterium]|nr:FxLYD domain-containing protein [Rhodothermales bacterium]
MPRRSILVLLLVLPVAGLLAGCGEGAAPLNASVEELQLVRRPEGDLVLTGLLVNTSERAIGAAQIEVELFEGGDEPVETMRIEVQDVGPGEEKRFRQVVDTRRPLSGARVGSILLF